MTYLIFQKMIGIKFTQITIKVGFMFTVWKPECIDKVIVNDVVFDSNIRR